jgi:hypothetical protein
MKSAMEEKAFILLESLMLSIRNAIQNPVDIEEEGNISLEALLLSNGNGKGTPSFHSIHYCCLLGIQFVRIMILFNLKKNIACESLLLSNGNGSGRPASHSIPDCCLLGI